LIKSSGNFLQGFQIHSRKLSQRGIKFPYAEFTQNDIPPKLRQRGIKEHRLFNLGLFFLKPEKKFEYYIAGIRLDVAKTKQKLQACENVQKKKF
jgi:hypothetical protein